MAQSPTLRLNRAIERRKLQTLKTLPPHAKLAVTPVDRLLETRIEAAKAKLLKTSADFDGRIRWASMALTGGLALLRWRSGRNKRQKRKR